METDPYSYGATTTGGAVIIRDFRDFIIHVFKLLQIPGLVLGLL